MYVSRHTNSYKFEISRKEMKLKLKKLIDGSVARTEGEGKISEVIVKPDLLNPKNQRIEVCFRGFGSSGIVELSADEAKDLSRTLRTQSKAVGKVKFIKGF